MRTLTEYLESICAVLQNEANRTRYSEIVAQSETDLRPQGMLEIVFAAAIVRALWRLEHQAGASEADIARLENGMRRNTAELRRLQTDRHLKAELGLDLPGLVSAKDALKWLKQSGQPHPHAGSTKAESQADEPVATTIEATLHSEIGAEEQRQLSEFHERQKQSAALSPQEVIGLQSLGRRSQKKSGAVPRNAPCPCKSGQKYKRCCGSDAPPQYNLSPQRDRAAQAPLVNAPPQYNLAA